MKTASAISTANSSSHNLRWITSARRICGARRLVGSLARGGQRRQRYVCGGAHGQLNKIRRENPRPERSPMERTSLPKNFFTNSPGVALTGTVAMATGFWFAAKKVVGDEQRYRSVATIQSGERRSLTARKPAGRTIDAGEDLVGQEDKIEMVRADAVVDRRLPVLLPQPRGKRASARARAQRRRERETLASVCIVGLLGRVQPSGAEADSGANS